MSHDVGRTRGRGGGSGCEEQWKPRRRGGEGRGGEPMTREKREGDVWIVTLIPCRDWQK